MGASPTWDIEDDHLPAEDTARGAALVYFAHLGSEALDRLGVVLIEGDCPRSTYFAAELHADMVVASRAAERPGIPVRFEAGKS